MRFTSNAFIVSTVALLSLIIPGVNADVAEIISPSSGETFYPNEMINLIWTVTDTQGLASVNCDIVLLQFGSSPSASGVLQTGVPVLNGISNGPVQIPSVASHGSKW